MPRAGGSDIVRRVVRRLLASLLSFSVLLALLAPAALAHNDGRGFYGETTDKAVTNAGFIIIAFFPIFITLASLLQWRLEKRKHARQDAKKARTANAEWRGGW